MRSPSRPALLSSGAATSWSDFLAALKPAIETGAAPPSTEVLIALAQETLAQTIEEPAHSAKVKKAEIAALILGALERQIALDDPAVLPLTFPLSGWTAGHKTTNALGLALLSRNGALDASGWGILVASLLRAGNYQAIRRITEPPPTVAFDQYTLNRIAKANGALALRDIRDDFRAGRMPPTDVFARAYTQEALPLVRSVMRALLDWQDAPDQPLPVPEQDAATDAQARDVTPLFCSGFRWSGASAVYDFIKGLDGVGTPVRHPRIVSGGVAPLEDILDHVLKGAPVDQGLVIDFILEKILGVPPSDKTPKIADLFRRSVVGGARDAAHLPPGVTALLRALQGYAGDGSTHDKIVQGGVSMRTFYARIAQCPEDCRYTAYDSVMRAWRPELVQTVSGARMIGVIRDPRDMYVTYLRMERPSLAVQTFIDDFGARLTQYEAGRARLGDDGLSFRLLRFEDFVLDAEVRQSLCDWLGLENTADLAQGDFIPEQSARNIGVYKTHPDTDAIAKIEAAFPDWCFRTEVNLPPPEVDPMALACSAVPAAAMPAAMLAAMPAEGVQTEGAQAEPASSPETRLNVLSFSAMASKPMMEDAMSLSGKKGDPGWAVRKGITASLIAEGKYDFVGLQHTQFDVDPDKCGTTQILSEINARVPGRYQVLNADDRFGVQSGDSLPIYYDTARWELVPDHYGVQWFKAADAAKRRIGGGRFYVYGLFRQTSAAPGDALEYVWVYNLRLIHKSSDELDQQRTRSLVHVIDHITQTQAAHNAPVVILADTNIKEPDAMATRYLNGDMVTLDGADIRSPVTLVDAFIKLHPELLNKISSQHNFKPAGKTKGTGRNDRILMSEGFTAQSCSVLTYNHDGNWPSYHFPIEAVLEADTPPATV